MGKLCVREFRRAGLHPLLAGRSAVVGELARRAALPSAIFDLRAPRDIERHLAGVRDHERGPRACDVPRTSRTDRSSRRQPDRGGEVLSGDAVGDVAGAAAALTELGGRIKNVIVTLGGDGPVVGFGQNVGRTIAPTPVKAVSSHGAGDCFVGALAAQVAGGASLMQAAEFANAAAAAHVSGQGAMMGALPTFRRRAARARPPPPAPVGRQRAAEHRRIIGSRRLPPRRKPVAGRILTPRRPRRKPPDWRRHRLA